ncbi:MAG: DUF4340 domain-containing protein [Cyclobacteriaceae bacterium]|nr:DUF4340 domain-containing protein [Cyclobacteriaceae bacterium]
MNQEKKNKVLVASLGGLLMLVIVLFFYQNDRPEVNKNIFKVDDLALVDRVVLSSVGSEVELSFTGSKWLVNQNQQADEQLITVLFATLQQAEPKRQVANNLKDSISTMLIKKGIKVTLYEGGTSVRSFYVGGNAAKTEAYFLDEQLGPFVMTIPGYRVYVTGIFELDAGGWRDKRIFNFNWRNFKKLETDFAKQSNQSFTIEDQGSGFDLIDSPPSDTTKVNDYLDAVSLLMAKQYLPVGHQSMYDSLIQTSPLATIRVYDLGDNALVLELYPPIDKDPEVLGRLNGTDRVLFSREQIIPILKRRDYFKK